MHANDAASTDAPQHGSTVLRVVPDHAPAPVSKWERHARLLGEGVFVAGAWKTMGDCTAADFDWLAADRENRAKELAITADRYRGHAADIRDAGVTTFAELYATGEVAA